MNGVNGADSAAARFAAEFARKAAEEAARKAAEKAAAEAAQKAAEAASAQPPQARQRPSGKDSFQQAAPTRFPGDTAAVQTSTLATENRKDGQANCLDQVGDQLAADPALRAQGEVIFLNDTRPGAEGQSGHVVIKRGNEIWDPASEKWSPAAQWLRNNPQYQVAGSAPGEAVNRILEAPPGEARNKAIADSGISPALINMAVADEEVDIFADPFNADSAAEAAAVLMQPGLYRYNSLNGEGMRAADFASILQQNRDNPEFVAEFLQALGPENTMTLMADLQSQPAGDREVLLDRQLSTIRNTLNTAVGDGLISRDFITDMARQGDPHGLAYLHSFITNPAASNLTGTYDAVLNALVERTVTGSEPSFATRLATEMLAEHPDGLALLEGMSPATRERFLQSALSLSPSEPFHGVDSPNNAAVLFEMARQSTDQGFRAHMFKIGAESIAGINPTPGVEEGNMSPLVDSLKGLFQADAKYIATEMFAQSASNPVADGTWSALGAFFEQALFTTTPDDPFVDTVSTLMGGLRQDMLSAAGAGDVQGANMHAKLLGNVAGSIQVGFYQALEQNNATAEGRLAMVEILTGGAMGLGGTPGSVLGGAANMVVQDLSDLILNGDLRANAGDMNTLRTQMLSGLYNDLRLEDFNGADGLDMEGGISDGMSQISEGALGWISRAS